MFECEPPSPAVLSQAGYLSALASLLVKMTPIVTILLGGFLGELVQKPLASLRFTILCHVSALTGRGVSVLQGVQNISLLNPRAWLSDSEIPHCILAACIIVND